MDSLKKAINRFKWDRVITAVLAVVLGILFIVVPADSAGVLCTIAGIILITAGVVAIIAFISYSFISGGFTLVTGLALIMAGIFCLTNPEVVTGIMTLIFGIYIVVDAANSLAESIECARMKIDGWFLMLLLSALNLALGIMVVFGRFDTIMIFAGISLIIDGLSSLIATLVFKQKLKDAKRKLNSLINAVYADSDAIEK